MHVTVATLFDRGRRLPKWREGRPGVAGKLEVRETFDAASGRMRRTATLLDTSGRHAEQIAPLLDATVLYVSDGRMTITGIERLTDERTGLMQYEHAQSWAVVVLQPPTEPSPAL